MGMCHKCHEFFGSDYLIPDKDKPILTCVFCSTGKDRLTVLNKDEKEVVVTKQECIGKYKEFMKKIMSAEEIRKKILVAQVKGEKGVV